MAGHIQDTCEEVNSSEDMELTHEDDDQEEVVEWAIPEGAQILLVDAGDGQQQLKLVMEDTNEVVELPPEVAEKLQEKLSAFSPDELETMEHVGAVEEQQDPLAAPMAEEGASSNQQQPYELETMEHVGAEEEQQDPLADPIAEEGANRNQQQPYELESMEHVETVEEQQDPLAHLILQAENTSSSHQQPYIVFTDVDGEQRRVLLAQDADGSEAGEVGDGDGRRVLVTGAADEEPVIISAQQLGRMVNDADCEEEGDRIASDAAGGDDGTSGYEAVVGDLVAGGEEVDSASVAGGREGPNVLTGGDEVESKVVPDERVESNIGAERKIEANLAAEDGAENVSMPLLVESTDFGDGCPIDVKQEASRDDKSVIVMKAESDPEDATLEELEQSLPLPDLDEVEDDTQPDEAMQDDDEELFGRKQMSTEVSVSVKLERRTEETEKDAATTKKQDDIHAASAENEWTESFVTSSAGTIYKVRIPALPAPSSNTDASDPTPHFRVVGADNLRAAPPPVTSKKKKKQKPFKFSDPVEGDDAFAPYQEYLDVADDDEYLMEYEEFEEEEVEPPRRKMSMSEFATASARRKSSRGIAHAVAALMESDSDYLPSSEESGGDERPPARAPPCPPQLPVVVPAGARTGGRGRPRKKPGFACQQCGKVLATQDMFYDHVGVPAEGRVYVEEPAPTDDRREQGGAPAREPTPAPADDAAEVRVDGVSEINVHIIANDKLALPCEECSQSFDSEEELLAHSKTHLRQRLMRAAREAAAGEQTDDFAEAEPADDDPDFQVERPTRKQRTSLDCGYGAGGDKRELSRQTQPCSFSGCRKLFSTKLARSAHVRRVHSDRDTLLRTASRKERLSLLLDEFECLICHMTYTSQKVYDRHRQLHDNFNKGITPYQCSKCGSSFLTSMTLWSHINRLHPEMNPKLGGQAPQRSRKLGRPHGSYKDENRGRVYELIECSPDGEYYCRCCGHHSKTKQNLFYHVSVKHKAMDMHKCSHCDKEFFYKSSLVAHERQHTGERPFACLVCQACFRSQTDLNSHMQNIHGEKAHKCTFCGKAFSRNYSLKVHMRCHTNERSYVCPLCQKRFRAANYLSAHMKIHTGEKAHKCPFCGKAFRMRSDMKRHIFTHTSRERGGKGKPSLKTLSMLLPSLNVSGGGVQRQDVIHLDAGELGNLQLVIDDQLAAAEAEEAAMVGGELRVEEGGVRSHVEAAVASAQLAAGDDTAPVRVEGSYPTRIG